VEKSFDVGKEMLIELINHVKVEIDATTNPVMIHFKEDMQKQMNEYIQYIPGKKRLQGRSVVLDTPDDVFEWIGVDNLPDDVQKTWRARVKARTKRTPWWRRAPQERGGR